MGAAKKLLAVAALLALAMSIAPLAHAGKNPNPGILPIDARPHGQSYGEWAAQWWQWALETPASVNPVVDLTGDRCAEGQTGSVWFLGGTFGANTPITRNCAVPAGKALFFPLLNAAYFAFLNDPPETRTEEFLRAQVICSEPRDLTVTIDGAPVSDPLQYLEADGPLFDMQLPEDNVFGLGPDVIPELLLSPSADRGYYLFLAPLSRGQHTIHWSGSWTCSFGEYAEDVTYNLTVGPAGR